MICQISKKEKKSTENVDWSLYYGILKVERLPQIVYPPASPLQVFILGEYQLG